ncbi:hypothetical protein KQJ29_34550, partial [Enterococcus sp. S181_ASV_20]|nr:hypothetical protein [Enterococcus sp. S181_ASV_20]
HSQLRRQRQMCIRDSLKRFLGDQTREKNTDFTNRQKFSLIVFALGFVVMIYGVQQLGWYFTEIAVVFLAVTYIPVSYTHL